jgi:hypothetical protein
MKTFAAICLLGMGLFQQSQPPHTGSASASGGCAVSHVGNSDTIIIKNCGIGQEQGEKIVALLKAVLANRGLSEANAKLDELLAIASKPSQSLNCIDCNLAGTNNGSQSLTNNYGAPTPPPNVIGLKTRLLNPETVPPQHMYPTDDEWPRSQHPGVELAFSIDAMFPNPTFLITCDRPCQASWGLPEGVSGQFSPKMLRTANPDVTGIMIGSMTPMFSGTFFRIRVRSLDDIPVSVLSVSGYVPPTK